MSMTTPTPELLFDEPMSLHTSWRVGGPADQFFRPTSVGALSGYLRELPADMALHWVGLGSNLLVRDGGIRGAVICTLKLPAATERLDDTRIVVGAGVPCTVFARQCVRWQLGPAAFFAGIPGTIGGALAMNAGAFGGETWQSVATVETIDRRGERHTRSPDEYEIGYRSVVGPAQEWFLGATFAFANDPDADIADVRKMLKKRGHTQPIGKLSCGSVFRNPPGQFAAQLIEAAGLKGAGRGDAVVSAKHANFILNQGAATAADIESLIEEVRGRVAEHSGIELQLEVRIIGDNPGRSGE